MRLVVSTVRSGRLEGIDSSNSSRTSAWPTAWMTSGHEPVEKTSGQVQRWEECLAVLPKTPRRPRSIPIGNCSLSHCCKAWRQDSAATEGLRVSPERLAHSSNESRSGVKKQLVSNLLEKMASDSVACAQSRSEKRRRAPALRSRQARRSCASPPHEIPWFLDTLQVSAKQETDRHRKLAAGNQTDQLRGSSRGLGAIGPRQPRVVNLAQRATSGIRSCGGVLVRDDASRFAVEVGGVTPGEKRWRTDAAVVAELASLNRRRWLRSRRAFSRVTLWKAPCRPLGIQHTTS